MAEALALSALVIMLASVTPRFSGENPSIGIYLLLLLAGFVVVMMFIHFIVTCHRLILLGDESVARFGPLKWTWRETRFVGWFVAIVACIILISIPAGFLLSLVLLPFGEFSAYLDESWASNLLLAPFLYVMARWSLVIPATAVDKRPDLRWAWRCSHGNGWRLALVVWLLPWITSSAHELLVREQSTLIEDAISFALWLVLFVIEIAALSLSYRELSQNVSIE